LCGAPGTAALGVRYCPALMEEAMGRYLLLWLLGVPIPILLLIWVFGGLN
jgi:hypothetical protein